MNKKKIASLLLVGTLLVGGGVLGAKAWFTASANVESDLVITTGTLSLNVTEDKKWTVQDKTNDNPNLVTEVDNKELINNFTNVRPGDSFVKTVKISNDGTLKVKGNMHIKSIDDLGDLGKIIELSIIDKTTNQRPNTGEFIMQPKEIKEFDIKIKLKGETMNNDYQEKTIDFSKIGDVVDGNLILIEGNQVNHSSLNSEK